MAQYTIQVYNQSGFPKSYVVFSEPPTVTSAGSQVQVFTNAWVTFPSVRNGGIDTLVYTDIIDAYWGTVPEALSPSVVVHQGGVAAVNTSSRDGVVFQGTSPAGFGTTTGGVANAGAFEIKANTDFTSDFNYVFGMAKPTGTGIPAPVATFAAEPNDTFEIIPVVKFYVADGAFTQGEIIDVKAFTTVPAEIDFTGKPQMTATVIQNANGSFAVQYS
ncbi:hypothetical protein HH212_19585 [Massilia forsythiae]|uniref:Uncharacterized protein n=2 Tax=Massilia forsythiae TaxID=2728020 RepID=A0A7Z2W2C0_9BURK|nr:hypothetical protein HH212_19585 [Massilia forsythiae]